MKLQKKFRIFFFFWEDEMLKLILQKDTKLSYIFTSLKQKKRQSFSVFYVEVSWD